MSKARMNWTKGVIPKDSTMPSHPTLLRLACVTCHHPSVLACSCRQMPSKQLKITVRWGDYKVRQDGEGAAAPFVWDRTGREEEVVVNLPDKTEQPHEQPVLNAHGLTVAVSVRPVVNDDTEGAHERNIEVGLIHSRALAERIVRHFEALLAEGVLKPVWDSRLAI